MALIEKDIDITKPLTKKQIKMLEKARNIPIPKDAEYPGFTDEKLKQFKRVGNINRIERENKLLLFVYFQRLLGKLILLERAILLY